MYIKNIQLKDYRNYEELQLDFNKNVNLILGKNAQGKTNLLEAIYMTSIGRSFRTSKDSELIRFGADFAHIEVEAVKNIEDFVIDVNILPGSKKNIKKNKISVSKTSELMNNILIVIFSPEDLKIVKDEPEKRRRFIDRELCQISPKYYDSLSNYKKILVQRNTYLKENYVDRNILDIWDVQLARYGADIIMRRKDFIEKISGYSSAIHNRISGGLEELEIKYKSNIEIQDSLSAQQEYFYEELKSSLDNDLKMRNTGKGPHKDDIAFFVNGINMRNFGSQGQQRTCALSLKLAELNLIKEETGEDAILLLDDVMSELDSSRQEYLIETLKENQLFITTTELEESIKDKFSNMSIFYVSGGKIE